MTEQVSSYHLFAVGEVAIYWRPGSRHHEADVTVIRSAHFRTGVLDAETGERIDGVFYQIVGNTFDSSKSNYFCPPQTLRKKRPPSDGLNVVRWDECPWQPETINV